MDQPYAQDALAVFLGFGLLGPGHLPRAGFSAGSSVRTVDPECRAFRAQRDSNVWPRYKALFDQCLHECLDVVAVHKTDNALALHIAKGRIPVQVARGVRAERQNPGVGLRSWGQFLYTQDIGDRVWGFGV